MASIVGDNSWVLHMFANKKARVGLRVQNRILCILVYNCGLLLLLCWVPNELNPADPGAAYLTTALEMKLRQK